MRKLFLGVSTAVLLTTGAMAADIDGPTSYDSSDFDWNGFYLGLGFTGAVFQPGSGLTAAIDGIVGVNVTSGDVLFGVEGWVGVWTSNFGVTSVLAGAEARLGYLVSPEALIYIAGSGEVYGTGAASGMVGAGIEFAVSDDMSLDLEYKYIGWTGLGLTGNSLSASVNWGF